MKLLDVASLTGNDHGFARTLGLMLPDVFFDLGYALLWMVLFATVRRGPRRKAVILLFHATTILVLVVFTYAHQHFQQTGTTLEYGAYTEWIPKLGELAPTAFQDVPPLTWVLLTVALLYATFGPWLLTRAVEWWREWPRRSRAERPKISLLGSLGLWLFPLVLLLLGFGFGSPSVFAGTNALAGEPFASVVPTGTEQEIPEAGAEVEKPTAEEDNSDTGPTVEHPAAHATLAQTSQTEKRNVVVVHLESTRARSVTPYNEDLNTTPFLNELAKNGLLVERAYVGGIPRSLMSNISVNCGIQPPRRLGEEADPTGPPVPCLAGLLKEQGYSTAFFSSNVDEYVNYATTSWGYEEAFAPPEEAVPAQYWSTAMDTDGFARTSHYGYEDDIMLAPSETWLEEQKDKPFVAEYLTNAGHDEYRCLETHYGSENFSDDDLLNHYLNCLRLQDIFLKNLFDQYKKLGLYDNTIFVLYGDHGEGFGEHGRFMHGDTIWDEGLKVPLIIHAPGWFEGGERVEGLSNYTDVLPTVLEMLGYEVKNGKYPGYSLLHPLPEDRTLMFSCISRRECVASIKGHEKYIYHYDNQPEEVFDLSNDPLEEHNLADEYSREDLDKRREDLFAWLSRIEAQYYGLGSPSEGDQSEEDEGQQAKQSGRQSPESPVAIGQPLTVGDVEWTVTRAYPTKQLSSAVDGGTKRGNFVVVDFQLKNNGDEGITPSSLPLALFDGNGRKFEFDTDTYLYIDWSKAIFRFETYPGGSQEGRFIFEVPPDASQFQLQLGEKNPFSGISGYVDLGF